jgi:uncharacterized membrane protein
MGFSVIPRRWRALLIVSLALNLLVAGILLGAALDRGGPNRGEMRAAGPLAPLVRALPPEDRQAVLGALRSARPPHAPPPRDRAATSAPLLAELRAEPFDPDQVLRALQDQRRRGEVRLSAAEAALAARLAEMTPDARAAYAGRLEEQLSRPR